MSTSLARQLQNLQSTQKDVIKTKARAKVSFLFESKEAYKIDDEVIYTLCLKGIEELSTEFPKLKQVFEHYKEDIFDETSKDFYRGTMTKDVIETLDAKLKHFITLLSPYFMHAASYKILEFLIRIYEVQAYHKTHVFFSFLPYYDTPQFLRLIQCMELKSDPMLSYFAPIVEKGVRLRLDALIRFMARENGAYLKAFSDIAFSYLTLRDKHDMYINNESDATGVMTSNIAALNIEDDDESIPHYRFWGTLVFKIISSEEASRSESYLYVLIPYIAKALDSKVRELQMGALSVILGSLDVSLLANKVPFSDQYMNAFLTEISKSASSSLSDDSDSTYFRLCLKSCLRILHAQQTIEKLNERLSMFSFQHHETVTNSKSYKIDDNGSAGDSSDSSYKWIGDIISNLEEVLEFMRENSSVDLSPLFYKMLEYYSRSKNDASESAKSMIKLLATVDPNSEIYKLVMSYCFAIIAEHLPECKGKETLNFAVLVLDYLETRDSFMYVQTLDTLLKGRNEKKLVLNKIEEIEIEQLGKSKKKVVTLDTGVAAQKETIPVLLALYHRKNNVKKAALLSLYQQWVELDDIKEGKDLRMISSMLLKFIEERESEDILIVTFTLLETLIEKDFLGESLTKQLYNSLTQEFIPRHFPPDRQYSVEGYMKGVSLLFKIDSEEFSDLQALVYLSCTLNEACKPLLSEHKVSKWMTKDGELDIKKVSLEKGLDLLTVLVSHPTLSNLQDGKIWGLLENYFSHLLKQSTSDPTICCLSLLSALKMKSVQNYEHLKSIICLFIGKLPSLANSERTGKDRLKVNEIIHQYLGMNAALIPAIFETLMIKHLHCDHLLIADYFTILYHENKDNSALRVH